MSELHPKPETLERDILKEMAIPALKGILVHVNQVATRHTTLILCNGFSWCHCTVHSLQYSSVPRQSSQQYMGSLVQSRCPMHVSLVAKSLRPSSLINSRRYCSCFSTHRLIPRSCLNSIKCTITREKTYTEWPQTLFGP